MLVDELRELTNNSKQYQKEYEDIVKKLREIAANGFNEITIMDVSNVVRSKLEEEGLTVIHRCELAFDQQISYDIIKW